jgi:hypothetical protein
MNVYRPTSLLDVVRVEFVVGSINRTEAPAIAAFEGSVISPLIVPAEVACAQAEAVATHAIKTPANQEETRFINPPKP